jgi:hypothetical protein
MGGRFPTGCRDKAAGIQVGATEDKPAQKPVVGRQTGL